MRAHQWPGIDPCMGRPLFPAAPGGVLSTVMGEEEEEEEEQDEACWERGRVVLNRAI